MAELRGGTTIGGHIAYHEGNLTSEILREKLGSLGSVLKQYKNKVIISADTNTVGIGIAEFNKTKDILLVFQNGMYIHQDADFTINDSNQIIKSSGNWLKDTIFEFTVVMSVNGNPDAYSVNSITKLFTATSNNTSVIQIGIPEYNKFTDILEVYFKNLVLYEGVNYTIGTDSITLLGTVLNINDQILFRVLKKTRTDATMIDTSQMKFVDKITGKKYIWGIENGLVFLEEVE